MPQKPLTSPKKRTGGRNNSGRITCRHRGGGAKQRYRIIDFKRQLWDVRATVERLEYEVYEPLAVSEGEKVIAEAKQLFPFLEATCVHRAGLLEIGDCAVWVGVSAAHRDEAFQACRYIIDQIKVRLPIWKKEHYVDGDSGWVNCERCANV